MDKYLRLIDANLNRSREGIRVCEDIARFMLNDKRITRSFKSLRHGISAISDKLDRGGKLALLKSRNVKKDIGKKTAFREGKRKDVLDVFYANAQRSKESLRVLEEITKLFNRTASGGFKEIRFKIYELEKKSRIKMETVLHNR